MRASVVVVHGLSCSAACGILVLRPGDRPHVHCTGRQSPNPWTTRESPQARVFKDSVRGEGPRLHDQLMENFLIV